MAKKIFLTRFQLSEKDIFIVKKNKTVLKIWSVFWSKCPDHLHLSSIGPRTLKKHFVNILAGTRRCIRCTVPRVRTSAKNIKFLLMLLLRFIFLQNDRNKKHFSTCTIPFVIKTLPLKKLVYATWINSAKKISDRDSYERKFKPKNFQNYPLIFIHQGFTKKLSPCKEVISR